MAIDALTTINAYPAGLGHEIVISFSFPATYPDDAFIVLLKSESAITPAMVLSYQTTDVIPDGITATSIGIEGNQISDFNCIDGTRYYYAMFLATVTDGSFTDYSTALYVDETPVGTAKSIIVDPASLIKRIIQESVLPKMGFVENKDIYVRSRVNILPGNLPALTISRGAKRLYQSYLGQHLDTYISRATAMDPKTIQFMGNLRSEVISLKFASHLDEQRTNFLIKWMSLEQVLLHTILAQGQTILNINFDYLGDSEMETDVDAFIYIHEILITVIHEVQTYSIDTDYTSGTISATTTIDTEG